MSGQTVLSAAGAVPANPVLNLSIFAVFVVASLVIVVRAARSSRTATDFYAGGRSFTGGQNGLAISGDYMGAASLMGVVGAIAVYGYDGFMYSIGFLVAWVVALLLVAELVRNAGRFTMADVLSFRLGQRPVRVAAALSTLTVCLLYLLAQMAGAGALVSLLLGIRSDLGQIIAITVVGGLMIVYVLLGGMKGTTWVQIIKSVLLLGGVGLMAVWALARYGFDFSAMLGAAAATKAQTGVQLLDPGNQYGASMSSKTDFISLAMALVLGTAGLPHVLMRFYTVPTARDARRSVVWAIFQIGLFYMFTLVLGYAAAALIGPDRIAEAPGGANSAVTLLAYDLGGSLLLGFISAVAFATLLAVVAGLTITAATSFAHDIYTPIVRKGAADSRTEIRVAKRTVVVIGILAIVGGIAARNQNVAFLIALAFAVAASANLPTILYSLYWRRFTTRGALLSMYGGLASSLVLIVLSPVMSGTPKSLLPSIDFAIFPLNNPGVVSIPLAFVLGWLGSLRRQADENPASAAEMDVRALSGLGAEQPSTPLNES